MQLVKDWWYAYKVCRKKNIRWNPFWFKNYACNWFEYSNGPSKNCKSTININPFYNNFKEVFLHEVGHSIYNVKAYNKAKNIREYEENTDDFLKEEYLCWRFAKKVMKAGFNKKYAQNCFMTYFPRYSKKMGCVQATDIYYKYDKSIGE